MSTPTPITPLAAPAIGSLAGALVETYLKPHLQKSARRGNKRKALDELTFFGGFQKYLDRALARHSHLTTLAMQGKPRLLSELYVPLTLVTQGRSTGEREVIRLDCYPDNLLPQLKRVLLTDDAGMGKSTLVKFLFIECANAKAGLPILIELRRLREGKKITDVLVDELCEVCPEISRDAMADAVNELLEAGEFVFFLDGYDEVPFDERERVALHIREFIERVSHNGRNAFLVSSRPDPGVSSLPGFYGFHIRPLEVEEAFSLLRKYDGHRELSKQLIDELQEQLNSVKEFLTNPMLVSLLFEAYDYTRTIPLKSAAFYRQVYDALFERHDATKPLFKREKYSELDKDDFERALRALGIRTFKDGVGYSKDELLSHIIEVRRMCPGLMFSESDFLQDLLLTVPLFASQGDYHFWKHKSLQEYFTARYICGDLDTDMRVKALRQISVSDDYHQILSLCYDFDYRTFRNTLIYELVKKFIGYYKSTYSEIDRSLIDEAQIHDRKMLCFANSYVVCHSNNVDGVEEILNQEAVPIVPLFQSCGLRVDWKPIQNSVTDYFSHYENFFAQSVDMMYVSSRPDFAIECILIAKENPIVEIRDHSVDWDEFKKMEREFVGLTFDTVLMDDDPDAFFNKPENFVRVNQLLSYTGGSDLIFEKCRDLLAEIESDLKREQSSSVLDLL